MAPQEPATKVTTTSSSSCPEKRTWFRQGKNVLDPGPPPDGGWASWRQVLGGFLTVFLCWGFINSFGLFQTYYTSQPYINASPSDISWIGSIQIFLLMLIGAYSGSASDSGYFRIVTIVGQCLFVFGIFMASVSRQYYQLLLSHGVTTGLGMGLMFIPIMSVVSTYWSPKRRSLALGSMLCGAAAGGIVLPVMFNAALPKIGFAWSMRMYGFIATALFALVQVLLKKRLPPKEGVRILELEALKDKIFVTYIIGSFLTFLGLYFAFFFIGTYARNILGLSFSRSNFVLLVINGAGIPGRLLPMWLADQRHIKFVRPITVQAPLIFVSSMLLFVWIAIDSESSVYVFAAFYGFAANAVQSLFPATLADMTRDSRKTGAQIGWGFTIGSFPCLLGQPLGGLLVQADSGNFLYAQIYAGLCTLCGFLVVAFVGRMRFQQERATNPPST